MSPEVRIFCVTGQLPYGLAVSDKALIFLATANTVTSSTHDCHHNPKSPATKTEFKREEWLLFHSVIFITHTLKD